MKSIELSRQIDKNLREGVAGIEMEISDSVLEKLLSTVAARQEEEREDGASTLLLQAIDCVARHVDVLRSRSDPAAFSLIEELWKAYEDLLSGRHDEEERWNIASTKIKKVMIWQHQRFIEATGKSSGNRSDIQGLPQVFAELMRQQIAETSNLVEGEMAALKEMVGDVSVRASQKAELDKEVSAAFAEHVDNLQKLLNNEIGRLRHDLKPDKKTA